MPRSSVRMVFPRIWMLDFRRLDVGHWTLDVGHWTLDIGGWTLDFAQYKLCFVHPQFCNIVIDEYPRRIHIREYFVRAGYELQNRGSNRSHHRKHCVFFEAEVFSVERG